jgi:hypothetical protein
MENRTEYIDKMVIKLKVLESRIQKLESITDEVLNDVKSEYQQQIKELYQKKEAAQQELLKIKEVGDSM